MVFPLTKVRTSHALTIRAGGETIGLINSWNPTQNRTVTPIFEVGINNSSNPVEYMPGNATGLNITVNRYDTYPIRMEYAFGTKDLIMLTRQSEPFDVHEVWINLIGDIEEPSPIEAKEERFIYRGCWFTSLGRTISATDTRIISVNATLVYTQKLAVKGLFRSIADSSFVNAADSIAGLFS